MDSCIVCWEINVDATCRIFTTLKEWPGMQQVIKKHLSWWCLRDSSKNNSAQWICRYCWQEISSFHYFYVRVEKAQEQFPMISVFQNVPKSPNTVIETNTLKNAKEVIERQRVKLKKSIVENMQLTIVDIENEKCDHDVKPFEQINTLKRLKGDKQSAVVDSVKQNTAIDDDLKEFLMESKQKAPVFKDDVIKMDSFHQLNAIKLEELTIVDIKHETVSERTNEINFEYQPEPIDQQDDEEQSAVVDPIKQNTAIDDDLKEFLMDSEQKSPVFKGDIIKTDTFQQLKAIKLEEFTIVDIKNEAVSGKTDEINFDYELEPMDQQDDDEEECNSEYSPTNNSEYNLGKQFHNSINNYLEYQERREGIKNLNQINDEFIAANFKLCCDICNENLTNFKILKIHYQTKHNIPGYAMCCGKKWLKPYLIDHIHYHKNADYFKCPDCGKTYSTRYYFLYHIGEHKKRRSITVECNICGIKLATKANLKNHINRMHVQENLKEHICPICSRVSASFGIHKDHIKFAHATERKHKCHICTKAFKYPKLLREHISTHTRVALYSCPYCPETFLRSNYMYNHRKSMHFKEWEKEQLKKPLDRQIERGRRKKLRSDLSNS